MDKELFISKLNIIFNEQNREVIKYADAWLSRDTFGGIYYSPYYVLNVKVMHNVASCMQEIGPIIKFVHKGMTDDEFAQISSVHVCYVDDDEFPSPNDIVVFSLQNVKAA